MHGMPALVVTIDTEEEGRWSSSYPAFGNSCRNIERLSRIHELITRTGAIPTYLVDYPVATDLRAREILKGFSAEGRAEIGAHLHPWCNPPIQADNGGTRATYPHNLTPDVQRAKLETLCDAIEQGIGARPRTYRAGRWGFDHTSIPVLERLGIEVDTSVTPLWWDRGDGGPVFARAPLEPYRISTRDACRPGDSAVVEVPASNLVVGPHGPVLERLVRVMGPAPGMRRLLVGLGFRSLRPEQYTLQEMKGLADAISARGLEVFNVMFHSSVGLPGATPYARDERGLDEFCHRLEGLLEHIMSRHGAEPLRLSSVPARLGASILSGRAA